MRRDHGNRRQRTADGDHRQSRDHGLYRLENTLGAKKRARNMGKDRAYPSSQRLRALCVDGRIHHRRFRCERYAVDGYRGALLFRRGARKVTYRTPFPAAHRGKRGVRRKGLCCRRGSLRAERGDRGRGQRGRPGGCRHRQRHRGERYRELQHRHERRRLCAYGNAPVRMRKGACTPSVTRCGANGT